MSVSVRPMRQYTHLVTVQAPKVPPVYHHRPSKAIPLRESSYRQPVSAKRFLHVPLVQSQPPAQRIQPQPQPQPVTTQTIQPQYLQKSRYPSQPLRYSNMTFLLPHKVRKPTISDEDEARNLAGKRHMWGRANLEVCFI